MKRVKQFRYYGDNKLQNNNYPPELSYQDMKSGNIFRQLKNITQLGVQGPPGTKFYINNSLYPMIIGHTGIFELNVTGIGQIFSIRFDPNSLELDKIMENYKDGIIIDVLYDGEDYK